LYIIIAKVLCTFGDDIPLLSQWIKKFDKFRLVEFFVITAYFCQKLKQLNKLEFIVLF